MTMSHLLGKRGPGCILAGAESYSKSENMTRRDTWPKREWEESLRLAHFQEKACEQHAAEIVILLDFTLAFITIHVFAPARVRILQRRLT
jgi:hypothetical protein